MKNRLGVERIVGMLDQIIAGRKYELEQLILARGMIVGEISVGILNQTYLSRIRGVKTKAIISILSLGPERTGEVKHQLLDAHNLKMSRGSISGILSLLKQKEIVQRDSVTRCWSLTHRGREIKLSGDVTHSSVT